MKKIFSLFVIAFFINVIAFFDPTFLEAANFDRVVRVVDGDTVIVKKSNGTELKIELFGIDAPEIGQDFSNEAKGFLEKKVLNKKIDLIIKSKAQENYSAVVWVLSGYKVCVNEEMVRQGLAWSVSGNYMSFEKKAQRKKKGLWSSTNPTSPKEYRRLAQVQKNSTRKKAKKRADEEFERKFLEEYFIEQDINNKNQKAMEQYLNQSEYSIYEIYKILSLYNSKVFEDIFVNNMKVGRFAKIEEENKKLDTYLGLIAKCIKTVRDQENIEDIKKKELIEKLENNSFEFKRTFKNITRKIEEHSEREKKEQDKKFRTPTETFAQKNDSVEQCDAISMYVNTSSMGKGEKTIIDIRFYYTSTELGGPLYWKGESLDCTCTVYSNGSNLERNTDTLTSYDQHFFVELSSGDINNIKGGAYIECKLRPDGNKIELRKNLYFR